MILTNKTLRWSSPLVLNDKYELQVMPAIKLPKDKLNTEQISKIFEKNLNLQDVRILSLTEVSNCKKMWNKYGDKGKGCVLEFDSLVENSFFTRAKKMRYTTERSIIYNKEIQKAVELKEVGMLLIESIIFTKEKKWSYEKEWRLVYPNISNHTDISAKKDKNFTDFGFHNEELTNVVFGNYMKRDTRKSLLSIINKHYPHINK